MASLELSALTMRWVEKLRLAHKHKWDVFGKYAHDAMEFYSKPHDDYFDRSCGMPTGKYNGFKPTVNLVSNLVQVFLPALYHRNPIATVTPRRPAAPKDLLALYQFYKTGMPPQPNPMQGMPSPEEVTDKLRGLAIEFFLNATPVELDLKGEARRAITEALIKGRGLLWASVFQSGSGKLPGSQFVSVDDLLVDPDSETLVDAKWIARRRRRPCRDVEREFGLKRGELKGDDYSAEKRTELRCDEEARYYNQTDEGTTADLITYYEVYSRFGLGTKLKGGVEEPKGSIEDATAMALESLGENVFLAIAPGVKYPLNLPDALFENLPPEMQAQIGEIITQAIQWPFPFHADHAHPWPFAELDFHFIPGCSWPQAHITPALGFVKAIDWIFSYMMGRIKLASRTFMVVPKDLDEEVKDAILYGEDLTLLDIWEKYPGTQDKVLNFLQTPNVASDIWQVLAAIQKEFKDATGMTDLLLGYTQTQLRSAQESNIKQQNASARPDDMANIVGDWMGLAFRNAAVIARTHSAPEDVAPIFGEPYDPQGQSMGPGQPPMPLIGPMTTVWIELVHTDDFQQALAEHEYRIEAGSAKKPDVESKMTNLDQSLQVWAPVYQQLYASTGNSGPLNMLASEWAKLRGMDPAGLMLPDMSQQMQMAAQAQAQPQGGAPTGGPPELSVAG